MVRMTPAPRPLIAFAAMLLFVAGCATSPGYPPSGGQTPPAPGQPSRYPTPAPSPYPSQTPPTQTPMPAPAPTPAPPPASRPDPSVTLALREQSLAASALGKLGDVSVLNRLNEKLDADNWQVRSDVAVALGRLGQSDSLPPLKKKMEDPMKNVRVCSAAAILMILGK